MLVSVVISWNSAVVLSEATSSAVLEVVEHKAVAKAPTRDGSLIS